MRCVSFFLLLLSILYGCNNKASKPILNDGSTLADTLSLSEDEDEVVVEIFEDTIWFSEYYALEYGPGRGNYSTRVSLYKTANDSVIVEGEYPVDYDIENQLILYREEDGERRLMLYDIGEGRFYDVKLPEGDAYRGFGSWSCYSIGEVTSKAVNILFECGDSSLIVVKRM